MERQKHLQVWCSTLPFSSSGTRLQNTLIMMKQPQMLVLQMLGLQMLVLQMLGLQMLELQMLGLQFYHN